MMRKYLLGVLAALFTFTLGTLLAFSANWVASVQFGSSVSGKGAIAVEEYVKPRFSPWGRGCGNGYVQSYETDDGQRVAEGIKSEDSRRSARREFQKQIRDAERIVERVQNNRNYLGKLGERVVLISKANESGDQWASILWYDGGDTYSFVEAPTLDLALEFEQYLININYSSPF